MLVETVLGPLWVWLVLGEEPSVQTILAGVLILGVLGAHSALGLTGRRESLRA